MDDFFDGFLISVAATAALITMIIVIVISKKLIYITELLEGLTK